MDKASDYESGDSRFESWRGRLFFSLIKEKFSQTVKVDILQVFIHQYIPTIQFVVQKHKPREEKNLPFLKF